MIPSIGQQVRVVIEGEVTSVFNDGEISIGTGRSHVNYIHPDSKHVVSIEVLSDPEPDIYSVVITSDGKAWARYPTSEGVKERWACIGGTANWSTWEELDDPRPAVRAE